MEKRMKKQSRFCICFVFILLFCTIGFSEDIPAPAVGIDTTSNSITMNFKDADIRQVLEAIATKVGVSIIAGKDVTGAVTFKVTNIPWEKALDELLKAYGYAYVRDGDIVRVTTREALKAENVTTEVFLLNFAKAESISKSVQDMLSERGKINVDTRSNVLIVTDIPTNLVKIKEVISRIDSKTPQVMIEAKIIETTLSSEETLGIDWATRVTAVGSKRPTTFPFNHKQSGGTYYPLGDPAVTEPAFPIDSNTKFPYTLATNFTFGTLDFSTAQAVFEILKTTGDSKIISNPRVATLNGKEANILVGEVLYIPKYERNTNTGQMEITGYTERNIGIELTVTPTINEQGYIVANLHPEVSELLRWENLTEDIRVPIISTREATTEVMIKDGYTIVIGGLIKENLTDSRTGVPVLKDIPLLGFFFGQKSKSVTKTDLLVFITPRIVKEGVPQEELKSEYIDTKPMKALRFEREMEPAQGKKKSNAKTNVTK
ncbi:MAG: secretin and TonB N-terminal domain-containing protein [Candidatus Omnitrophota bacterium]